MSLKLHYLKFYSIYLNILRSTVAYILHIGVYKLPSTDLLSILKVLFMDNLNINYTYFLIKYLGT